MKTVLVAAAVLVTTSVLGQMRGIPTPLPVKQGTLSDGGTLWSVKLDPPAFPADGGTPTGSNVVASTSYPCSTSSVTTVYTLDSGVETIGTLNPRVFVEVCHTRENDVGLIKCRGDGDVPSMTKGTKGEVLTVGECVTYGNPGGRPVYCLGNKGTYVQSFECAP
jgi:hypothetical protein